MSDNDVTYTGPADDDDDFDGRIDKTQESITQFLVEYPQYRHLTIGRYEVKPPGDSVECLVELEPSLLDQMKRTRPDLWDAIPDGLTGSMVDLALTRARTKMGLGPTRQMSEMIVHEDGTMQEVARG